MKVICLALLFLFTTMTRADFRPASSENKNQKDQTPSAINVSFNMGNSQEAPPSNASTISPTQQVRFEHIHKNEPFPQESLFNRIKNGFVSGVATAAGSAITYQIIEYVKKIMTKG